MAKIKHKLQAWLHAAVSSLPEALLALFVASLVPLVLLVGEMAFRLFNRLISEPATVWAQAEAEPWTPLAWALCVAGGIVLLWLLWIGRAGLWAVARKMIIEAMHRRVVVVLLVFFIVLAPSLPFILKTEGNPKSQVQIVLSYSLSLAEILLSLVAIVICTASLCSEIERKQVQVTDPKPLPRWQFLGGKLLGVVVMCAAILFLMAASIYGLVNYMARDRNLSSLSQLDAEKQQRWLPQVRDEVLVTRRAVRPLMPDVSTDVEKEIERRIKEGMVDGTNAQAVQGTRSTVTDQFQKRAFTAPAFSYLEVPPIRGLAPNLKEPVFLRFKARRTNTQAAKQLEGEWLMARVEPASPEEKTKGIRYKPVLIIGRPGPFSADSFQEVSLPGELVNSEGVLLLAYRNYQGDTGVQFDPKDGIEVLQKTEGFFPNYYRALLVILCRITVLAAVALMAGAAFSFPVASFTVAAIFFIGLITPWVIEAAGYFFSPGMAKGATYQVKLVINTAFRGFVWVLDVVMPHFGSFNPRPDLVSGKIVSWGFVAQAAAVNLFIKGAVAMLVAVYVYSRRELARVIV